MQLISNSGNTTNAAGHVICISNHKIWTNVHAVRESFTKNVRQSPTKDVCRALSYKKLKQHPKRGGCFIRKWWQIPFMQRKRCPIFSRFMHIFRCITGSLLSAHIGFLIDSIEKKHKISRAYEVIYSSS